MKNPTIVRWTIGDVSEQGFACLWLSVRKMMAIYGKEGFRYIVCHNGVARSRLDLVASRVELVDQERFADSLPIPPSGVSWKLYPPRLDIEAREVFVDNDLVIHRRIDLERMPASCFISEALGRNYGSLDPRIASTVNMNSGFFGVPPGLDLRREIAGVVEEFGVDWNNSYFEEQGVVAYIIHKNPHWVFRMNEIAVLWPKDDPRRWRSGSHGTHFVGLNKGDFPHWLHWRSRHRIML